MSRIVIIFMFLILLTTLFAITAGFAQTNWEKYPGNPVLEKGTTGEWDENGVIAPGMLFDSTTYHIWYTGFDVNWKTHLGYATSPDATTWTKHLSNPVLDPGTPGEWDQSGPGSPSVVFDDITYHMWYDAGDSSGSIRIGYATSPDRVTWTKHGGNPVLDIGSPGEWDDEGIFNPMVIFDNTTFHMWYGGWDSLNVRIGYATSLDGITWTKSQNNPVLDLGSPGSWDDAAIAGPSVIFDGATYQMWYTGGDTIVTGNLFPITSRTGYATSPDGINWTKFPGNPVLDIGSPGAWDDLTIFSEVLFHDSTYHMWYSGLNDNFFPWSIGYAVDSTIITFIRELKSDIPTAFALEQNYPNPFNPSTKISYSIPKSDFVILKIYNVLGIEVQSLVNDFQNTGTYILNFDASELSSGVYFYRLQVGNDFVKTRKMLLMQ